MPYTISYVIRKRTQIDNLNELPKEKRPPEIYLWDKSTEDLEMWLDGVLGKNKTKEKEMTISLRDIEG